MPHAIGTCGETTRTERSVCLWVRVDARSDYGLCWTEAGLCKRFMT